MKTFPNIKQKVGSKTCGPNCLLNIYQSLEIKTDLNKILKELNVTTHDGTYLPQLARHLNDNKLETVILTSNPFSVSPTWKNKSTKQIIEALKKWLIYHIKDEWLKENLFLLFYLEEGGGLKIIDLSTNVIDEYLDKGYLVISCLEESWLWQKRKIKDKQEYDDIKGHARGHYVVVYGKEDDNYLISDPYPTKIKDCEGLYKVNKQQLLIATLVWDMAFIAIKNNNWDRGD